MKLIKIVSTLLTAILMVACGSGGGDPVIPETPDVPEKPEVPELSVPNGQEDFFTKDMVFESEGGERTIAFICNVDWKMAASGIKTNWCTIYPTSGKAGESLVKVKVAENTSFDERSIVLKLTAGSLEKNVKVVQKQKNSLTLTTDKFEVDAKGGEINVEVKSNINFDIVIPEKSSSWISQSTKSRGLTASHLVFTIAESEELDKREGEIIIKSGDLSETVHVYQSGQKILLLSKNEYEVSDDGETIKVELKSNFDYAVKMPQVDWIVEDKDSRGLSSHTLYYAVQANLNHDPREARIIFYDKESDIADTLHIVQTQKNALIVGQKEYNVKAEGENIQVKVSHNVEYSVDIKNDWITKSATRGLTEDKLSFTIAPNETSESRTGEIVVTSKYKAITETITIHQSAKGGITITKRNFDVKAEGETIEVEVFTNIPLSVKVNQSWIEQIQSKSSRELDKKILYFKVAPNESYDGRKAEIELYNKAEGISEKVIVNQNQKNALIIGQKEFNVKAEGENIQVRLSSNVEYDVDIKDSWITQVATRSLTEDNLTFSIKPNNSTEVRTGKIAVTSKDKVISEIITINQTAKENLTITQKNYSVQSDGETIAVEIESNTTFSTKIYATWIQQVSSKATRSNHTVLYFKVDANQSYDSRTAPIEFYNREAGISERITVFQAQKDALIASRKSFNVKAEGDVIQIKLNRNIDYNIKIEGSWITQTSTRGLVEDVLSFTIKANETTTKRSGKIIISSKDNSIIETVIISQYGKSNNADGDAGGTAPDFPWG